MAIGFGHEIHIIIPKKDDKNGNNGDDDYHKNGDDEVDKDDEASV